MKILFIYPDIITNTINFCPAIHILSAVLKEDDCQVEMLHINNDHGIKYDKKTIVNLSKGYDLYAITSTSFNYKYANEIAGWIKNNGKLVMLGGSHATIQPEDFKDSNFDIFCVGEGEEPMRDLVHAIRSCGDWTKIPNLITYAGINPVRGFLRDLDALPFHDFDITDTEKILELRGGWLSISFSRGCPFSCTFCINHLFKQIEMGPNDKMSDYIRRRSPENVVAEMLSLVKKYSIKVFNFDDDLLTMNKKWMRKFSKLYAKEIFIPYNIKYAINSRASFINEEMAQLLSDSGCLEVRIGFETGNEDLRNQILNKFISNDELITACSNLDKHGVNTNLFAMMGVPGETIDTFKDTVDMTAKLKPKLMRMTFLSPYTHTDIYDLCKEKGLLKIQEIKDDSFSESPLIFPNLTDADIFCFRFLFPWFVNVELFKGTEYAELYEEAIKMFTGLSFERLKRTIPGIIKMDGVMSGRCPFPHYRYFNSNTNYFQLYDNISNTV